MVDDFFSKLAKREKVLVFVAALFVMMVIIDRFVLGPILLELKSMQAEIDSKLRTIRRNVRILSFRDSIVNEHVKHKDYFDTGDKSKEVIVSALLREVEMLAAQKSITVSNIQPGDVETGPIMDEYKTALDFTGKLRDVLEFMQALEDSDYLFQITQYSLAPRSKGSDIMKVNMSMSRVFMTEEALS